MQNSNQYYQPEWPIKKEFKEFPSSRHDAHIWSPHQSRSGPRSRSRSPIDRRDVKPNFEAKQDLLDEPADWDLRSDVMLDWFNSDLTLQISRSGFEGKSLECPGFETVWAGVRATYGVNSGRFYFEVRILENFRVAPTGGPGSVDNVARVGWSVNQSGLTLGEEPLSYGYGGTAKKSTDRQFVNYGHAYGPGDVIGAFVEYSYTDNVKISFSKNGVPLGTAYEVSQVELEEVPLFPHIYVKNVRFEANFGQHAPWCPPPDPHWLLIGQVPVENRSRGYLPPRSPAECEIVMMCGLPSSGKTFWAENRMRDMPEKKYNILGTNLILEKMKVNGLHRKGNYRERWEMLFQTSNQCLSKLLELAPKRRRNYILDQTNVFPNAQNRKMKPFEAFRRIAVVMVPPDHILEQRKVQSEKEEGKTIPNDSILDMKGNFSIPNENSSIFDEIIFPELGRDEAEEVVKQYNQQGSHKFKKPRGGFGGGPHMDRSANRQRNDSVGSSRSEKSSFSASSGYASGESTGGSRGGSNYPRDCQIDRKPNTYRSPPEDCNRTPSEYAPNRSHRYGNYDSSVEAAGDSQHPETYPGYGSRESESFNRGPPNTWRNDIKPSRGFNPEFRGNDRNTGPRGSANSFVHNSSRGGLTDPPTNRGATFNRDRGHNSGPGRGGYNQNFGPGQPGPPNWPRGNYNHCYQQPPSYPGDNYQNFGAPQIDMRPPFQQFDAPAYGAAPRSYPPFTGPVNTLPFNPIGHAPNPPYYENPPGNFYQGGYR